MARQRAAAVAASESNIATSVELTDTQEVTVTISPVDAKGNPAKIDGAPAWASSDETVVRVTPNPDDRTAVIRATGPAGSCRVSVTADADLGEGVQPIVGTLDVTVVAGQAIAVDITVGTPVEQGGI